MNLRIGILLVMLFSLTLMLATGANAAPAAATVNGAVISSGGGVIGALPRSVDSTIGQSLLAGGEADGVRVDAGLGSVIAAQDAGGTPMRPRVNLPIIFR